MTSERNSSDRARTSALRRAQRAAPVALASALLAGAALAWAGVASAQVGAPTLGEPVLLPPRAEPPIAVPAEAPLAQDPGLPRPIPPTIATAPNAVAAPPASGCPVLESGLWTAWIDTMASLAGARRLQVLGLVALPSPGYRLAWRLGPTDRAFPPGQTLELVATPPSAPTAQVVTEVEVTFGAATPHAAFRVLRIVCGETVLAEIADVSDQPAGQR